MGMATFFTPVGAEMLAQLREDPESVEEFLYPDDGEGEPEGSIDIDKAWDGMHFLLTRIAADGRPALADAVLGGEPIGPELDFGPARVLGPDQVKQIAQELSTVTPDMLAAAYDPAAMSAAEVYPDIWERDGQDALDYVTDFLPDLQAFYAEAAQRGDAVILCIG